MSNINVKFLGKDYTIPKDVVTYIELIKFTDDVKRELMRAFMRAIKNNDVGCIDDEDLKNDMKRQISRYIAKLCDNEIYDRTVNDYYKNNKGYEFYSSVNKSALEKMKDILMRKLDMFQAGVEDAMYKKESSVTGMGFSIWSSSFINHAIYAAMEASTLHDQEKQANAEYLRDINTLEARMESQFGGEQSQYINNVYIPNMDKALTIFSYSLLDKYIEDLISHGKFESNAIKYIDMSRSNELLGNLEFSNNKKVIIEKAFEVCPYNTAVYINAMKHDLLDTDSFCTAECFGQGEAIVSFLEENIGKAVYPKEFSINTKSVELLAKYKKNSTTGLLKNYTTKYANDVVREYNKIKEKMNDKNFAEQIIDDWSEETVLHGEAMTKDYAYKLIDSIVSPSVWNKLVYTCGHSDLLAKIAEGLPESLELYTKNDIDFYLKDRIIESIETVRKEECEKIKFQQEVREKARLEAKEKVNKVRKVVKRVVVILIVIALLGLIISRCIAFWDVKKAKKEAEQLIESIEIPVSVDEVESIEILAEMANKEIADKTIVLKEEYEELKAEVNTYEKYKANTEQVKTFYTKVILEHQELTVRLNAYAYVCAEMILMAENGIENKYDEIDSLYDTVYDVIGGNLNDAIYDGIMRDMYDTYYDGIIDDAQDIVEYAEWSEINSNEYELWSDTNHEIYEDLSDFRHDVHEFLSDVRSDLFYKDIDKAFGRLEEFKEIIAN